MGSFLPVTRMATTFPLRCVPVPNKAAATLAPAPGSLMVGSRMALAPSPAAFFRMASIIPLWEVNSTDPLASMIATRVYVRESSSCSLVKICTLDGYTAASGATPGFSRTAFVWTHAARVSIVRTSIAGRGLDMGAPEDNARWQRHGSRPTPRE